MKKYLTQLLIHLTGRPLLRNFILVFVFLASIPAGELWAQSRNCAFDQIRKSETMKDENFGRLVQRQDSILYERLSHPVHAPGTSGSVFQIPTVVHVIHQNGQENIPDSVIMQGINQLNLRFQNAAPYYYASGNAINIQFCLASIDPQGNVTNGITRVSSPLTYLYAGNDVQMKNLSRWDPHYYFNIWTVNSIFGFNISVAGYASMPANLGDPTDGVVVIASQLNSEVLNHEAGHYLGLYHTFADLLCLNFNCLMDGDKVCDTPPDTSMGGCMANSCSAEMDDTSGFNPFTMDVDELPNYMDYNNCPLSFTQGQADRMSAALTQIRFGLLQSHGCGFQATPAPIAQLNYEISVCNDGSVQFYDSASTAVNTVNWDFNNDGIYDSFAHNPLYTFPATGNYTVKLLTAGPGGVDSTYQSIFVQKAPSLYYPIVTLGGLFQLNGSDYRSCQNFINNLVAAPAQSYLWSNGDTTQSINFYPDSAYTVTLTIVDSAGLTWTNSICHPLVVNVQPLPPTPAIYTNDPSVNCAGDTVTMHALVNGSGGFNYLWYENSNLVAGATDSVYTSVGSMINQWYQLLLADTNGCYTYSNIIYSNFYDPPIQQSLTQNGQDLISGWGSGNLWYLDDVLIPGATGTTYTVTQPGCYRVAWFFPFAPDCQTLSDSICFLMVNVEELEGKPANQLLYSSESMSLQISLAFPSTKTVFQLFDASGRMVSWENIHNQQTVLDLSGFTDGIYIGKLTSGEKTEVKKLFINHSE